MPAPYVPDIGDQQITITGTANGISIVNAASFPMLLTDTDNDVTLTMTGPDDSFLGSLTNIVLTSFLTRNPTITENAY